MKKSMNSKLQLALVAIMATATTALVPLAVRGQSMSPDSSCPGTAPDHLPAGTLASLARQGFLEDQGIPSSATLKLEIKSGRVTPEQIVQAAIDRCLLSSKYNFTEDEEYLEELEENLAE